MSFRMAPTITTSNPLRSPLSTPTSRRVVLGNKTTNLTPTHHTHTPNPKHQRQELLNAPSDFFDIDGIKVRTTGQFASDEMARTKRPPRTPPTSYFFPPRPTHPPTPTNLAAGQKRGIDEIEKGDEHHDSENMTKEGNKGTGKQASATGGNGNLVSKFQSFERVMEEEGTGANKQDATFAAAENERATQRQGVTTMPSFHASQEGPLPLEEQFSIQEEMSQNTVDKLVCLTFCPLTGPSILLTVLFHRMQLPSLNPTALKPRALPRPLSPLKTAARVCQALWTSINILPEPAVPLPVTRTRSLIVKHLSKRKRSCCVPGCNSQHTRSEQIKLTRALRTWPTLNHPVLVHLRCHHRSLLSRPLSVRQDQGAY